VAAPTASAVPDVLAPGLRCVFCGINPGRRASAAGRHYANPRNDFWRLLADAGLTPRLLDPGEQLTLPEYGYGLTNAAFRTTKGSSELRRVDFEGTAERLEELAQERRLGETRLFVLPSTSPANAAVPYGERLRWFVALASFLARR
jgi:TDG/mug DNA glycosylase family protein